MKRLDGFGELAEHPLGTDGCGRIRRPLEASDGRWASQLGARSRSTLLDRRVRIARQPPEGLEDRQVGFTRAELLDALAASNAHDARP